MARPSPRGAARRLAAAVRGRAADGPELVVGEAQHARDVVDVGVCVEGELGGLYAEGEGWTYSGPG